MSDDAPTKGPQDDPAICEFSGDTIVECQATHCDCFRDIDPEHPARLHPEVFQVVPMRSIAEQVATVNLDACPFALIVDENGEDPQLRMFSMLSSESVQRVLEQALAEVRRQQQNATSEGWPF